MYPDAPVMRTVFFLAMIAMKLAFWKHKVRYILYEFQILFLICFVYILRSLQSPVSGQQSTISFKREAATFLQQPLRDLV